MEIIDTAVDQKTVKVYDQSKNIFNPITVEDVNSMFINAEDQVKEKAEEAGILEKARSNAETLIKSMLTPLAGESTIEIEWE